MMETTSWSKPCVSRIKGITLTLSWTEDQQMMKAESNVEEFGPEVVIRQAFIPEPGKKMGASDASQIEFRLFACYANAKSIIDAYANDPKMDSISATYRVMPQPGLTIRADWKPERKNRKHQNLNGCVWPGSRSRESSNSLSPGDAGVESFLSWSVVNDYRFPVFR